MEGQDRVVLHSRPSNPPAMTAGERSAVRLGIGVPTFNRVDQLARTLAAIARFTTTRYELLVADDGSEDGTLGFLRRTRTPHIAGPNRGIAWNKNRLLYTLKEIRRCDVIILIEDDTVPWAPGWETVWIEAALRFGHVNLLCAWIEPLVLGGQGSVADPYVSAHLGGQCASFTHTALAAAGYMDTRFKGYGYEHGEHTFRLTRAGYGGAPERYFLIRGDVVEAALPTSMTPDALATNAEQFHSVVGHDPEIYRHPWRSQEERVALQAEVRRARYLKGGILNIAWRLGRTNLRAWRLRVADPAIYLPGHQLHPMLARWLTRQTRGTQ